MGKKKSVGAAAASAQAFRIQAPSSDLAQLKLSISAYDQHAAYYYYLIMPIDYTVTTMSSQKSMWADMVSNDSESLYEGVRNEPPQRVL